MFYVYQGVLLILQNQTIPNFKEVILKVNSIQGVLLSSFAVNKRQERKVSASENRASFPVADNYGRAMVNFKSAKGRNIKNLVLKAPIEDKLAAVMPTLQSDELLIVSNNLKKALEMFKSNLKVLDFPVKKILHIQEPKMDDVLAFTSVDDYGNVRFYNVNEKDIEIEDLFMPLVIAQGDKQTLGLGARIKTSNGALQLKLESDTVSSEDIEAHMPAFIDEIDFDEQLTNTTLQHNKLILAEGSLPKRDPRVKYPMFKDVGGLDSVIKQVKRRLVFPIRNPEAFDKYFENKGVLFYGPPGTGKSFLAEAIGNEAGVSFFSVGGTDFNNKYVGESEKAFEEQIQKAIDAQPSILFIDEVDSLARKRAGSDGPGDKLLNKVLHSMTKLQGKRVYLIAATNNIALLDEAFLRSGRFGAQIEVTPPDLQGTEQIFDIHLKDKLDKNVDKAKLMKSMYDLKMAGADIAIAVREAYENALERLGVIEAMDNETYTPEMLKSVTLTQEDFDVVLDNFRKKNGSRREPVGFKTSYKK